jgi:hypothetical protein
MTIDNSVNSSNLFRALVTVAWLFATQGWKSGVLPQTSRDAKQRSQWKCRNLDDAIDGKLILNFYDSNYNGRRLMGSRLMVKMNEIYQSQIILLNWMFVHSLFAYCYNLVIVICLGLSLSDPIKWRLLCFLF